MQSPGKNDRILPKRGGFFCCPYCSKIPAARLLKVTDQTVAARVPLYCPKCRRVIVVDVIRGQAYECASPDRSE